MNEIECDFHLCKNYINKVLESVSKHLNDESYFSVTHYLSVDEYEMAFELLFTHIIYDKIPATIDEQECLSIELMLRLDKESVYDPSFWIVLNQWFKDR